MGGGRARMLVGVLPLLLPLLSACSGPAVTGAGSGREGPLGWAQAGAYGVEEAFPVFLRDRAPADEVPRLGADLGIDPASTRLVGRHDDRLIWLGTDTEHEGVCALIRTESVDREPWASCTGALIRVDPGRPLFSFTLAGTDVYAIWPEAGAETARQAGWQRIGANVWVR